MENTIPKSILRKPGSTTRGFRHVRFVLDGDQEEGNDRRRGVEQQRDLGVPAEVLQGWRLRTTPEKETTCCIKKLSVRQILVLVGIGLLVAGIPAAVVTLRKGKHGNAATKKYSDALKLALQFFNAQKAGRIPGGKEYSASWRGDSGLRDGLSDGKRALVGGFYDGVDNTKYHFPMSFSITLLSWSVIEYSHRYIATDEYNHVRDLIRWGTDYILLTFDSSTSVNEVGGQFEHTCWQRPEDMTYARPVQVCNQAPDLAAEMAAALASASIVFQDDVKYSKKLVHGAKLLYEFATDKGRSTRYSSGNIYTEPYYNSTGYYDEYMWSAVWIYYATGTFSFLEHATDPDLAANSKAFGRLPELRVFSWDNKLPGALLLLTRLNLLGPGQDLLDSYQEASGLHMCSNLKKFRVFDWTRGGLIQMKPGHPQSLQYVASSVFLASLFSDYLHITNTPGWYCGEEYILSDELLRFSTSQVNYILGENPMHMSYLVGYGSNYPRHVQHRGASIPKPTKMSNMSQYSCQGGWQAWYHSTKANPNEISGAMVGGPSRLDRFTDNREERANEPCLAGNAAFVAALASLTPTGGIGVDGYTMFTNIKM